jgi:hypothetical protein
MVKIAESPVKTKRTSPLAGRSAKLPSTQKAAGKATPTGRRPLRTMAGAGPNGDPPPLMLWGEE